MTHRILPDSGVPYNVTAGDQWHRREDAERQLNELTEEVATLRRRLSVMWSIVAKEPKPDA